MIYLTKTHYEEVGISCLVFSKVKRSLIEQYRKR